MKNAQADVIVLAASSVVNVADKLIVGFTTDACRLAAVHQISN